MAEVIIPEQYPLLSAFIQSAERNIINNTIDTEINYKALNILIHNNLLGESSD